MKNISVTLKIISLFIIFISGCVSSETNKGNTTNKTTIDPTPSFLPVEANPDSYQNDIEEYEPTDSLSMDSDGPVH